MGQTRKDSNQQIAAKVRGAERRRCPNCDRGNALSKFRDDTETRTWCRYCGYEKCLDRQALVVSTRMDFDLPIETRQL